MTEPTANAAADTKNQSLVIAAAMIADVAGRVSGKFDTFATWLLAAFGAALALLLSSHDALAMLPLANVRGLGQLFLWAVVVTVVEKYVAIIVSGGAEASASGRALVLEHLKGRRERGQSTELDFRIFSDAMMKSLFRPGRWIAARSIRKVMSGDLTAGSRQQLKLAQVQGMLVLIEIGLFLFAIGRIVHAIPN